MCNRSVIHIKCELMKKMFLRKFSSIVLLSLCSISVLFACDNKDIDDNNDDNNNEKSEYGLFTSDDYLKVEGALVKNQLGDEIILKGTNAGGYLVIEQWMCSIAGQNSYLDHKKTTNTFYERFGKEKTLELWDTYRDNFWTDYDFQNCIDMGMNVIRLPFSYMNVDSDYMNIYDNGFRYNFEVLDDFVEKAGEYGIYVILDLHGAYGSQNGQDHSGETMEYDDVDFYKNVENQVKTINLWSALTEHYKDNPIIAAFDLLNEPGEKAVSTEKRHWDFYDKLNDVVREIDEDRILIFESCWDGANLPHPGTYGWENCMYSFHNYSGQFNDTNANLNSYKNKIKGVEDMNFGVPFYMGEFNCYGLKDSWTTTLELLNLEKWHWTTWTYKLNRTNSSSYPGWGIYYSKAQPVVPEVDSFETIKEKRCLIKTDHKNTEETEFETDTLKGVMQEYLK